MNLFIRGAPGASSYCDIYGRDEHLALRTIGICDEKWARPLVAALETSTEAQAAFRAAGWRAVAKLFKWKLEN